MGDFKKRLLSALVIGPLVVLLFPFPAGEASFSCSWACVLVLAVYEFSSMAQAANAVVVTALAVLSLVPLYFGPSGLTRSGSSSRRLSTSSSGWWPGAPEDLSVNREMGKSIAVLVLAEVFLALPLFFLYRLKEIDRLARSYSSSPYGQAIRPPTSWGRASGRHKLAPLISPKKTFEGLLGALAGAALVTLLFRQRLGLTPPPSRSAWGS